MNSLNELAGRELARRQEEQRRPLLVTSTSGLGFCSTDPFLTEVILCVALALLGVTLTLSIMSLVVVLIRACRGAVGVRKPLHEVNLRVANLPEDLKATPFSLLRPSGNRFTGNREDLELAVLEVPRPEFLTDGLPATPPSPEVLV